MGQDDALLAPDWSDVTPGDLNGTEVSSTSHVYIPEPRYNQSKIHTRLSIRSANEKKMPP